MWHLENWQKILQNFRKTVFREVTHGLFTFSFLSLLAVHELHGWRVWHSISALYHLPLLYFFLLLFNWICNSWDLLFFHNSNRLRFLQNPCTNVRVNGHHFSALGVGYFRLFGTSSRTPLSQIIVVLLHNVYSDLNFFLLRYA